MRLWALKASLVWGMRKSTQAVRLVALEREKSKIKHSLMKPRWVFARCLHNS